MLSFVSIKNLSAVTNLAKIPGDEISLFCNSWLQSLWRQPGSKYLRKLPYHLFTSLEAASEISSCSSSYHRKSVLGKAPSINQLSY